MKFRERFFQAIAELVIRSHKAIVIIALGLTVLSAIAMSRIEVKTEIKDMMPADNPKVISFEEMNESFSGGEKVVILVEGTEKVDMISGAEDLAARIKTSPTAMRYIRNINLKLDRNFVADWGLMLRKADDIQRTGPMWRNINLVNYFRSLNDSFEEEYTGDNAEKDLETAKEENDAVSALSRIETVVEGLTQAIHSNDADALKTTGATLADTSTLGEEYSFSPNGTLLIFTLSPNFSVENIPKCMALTAEVKRLETETASRHPGISFGYAGNIPGNYDEQKALSADMLYPALVAYFMLALLFLVSFNSIRSIVLMLICLTMGIVMNYGLLGATLGEINLLTSILGALLIGMGIDYGINVMISYSDFRAEGQASEDAIRSLFARSGIGLLMAALTTVAGFFTFLVSTSKAMRQFGFVAGTGIITCLLAMTLVLPSLLLWFGGKEAEIRRRRLPQINYTFLPALGLWSARHRRVVVPIVLALVVGAGIFGIFINKFEYDQMKYSPQDIPSIIGYRKLLDHFGFSSQSASISLDSIEEAQVLTKRLEELRGVVEVNSVARYIASESEQAERLETIRALRETPPTRASLFYDEAELQALKDQVQRLEYNVIEMGDLSVAGLGDGNRIVQARNRMIREFFGAEVGREGKEVFQGLIRAIDADSTRAARNLTALDLAFAERLTRNAIRLLSADRMMTAADLPESVRKDFFDADGKRNLLTVVPSAKAMRGSADVLAFAQDLETVEPRISGALPLTVMWMKELLQESVKIGIILFFLVFGMMFISFRDLRYALLSMVPLVGGMSLMYGLVALFRVQISAFNLTMIPTLIGIGIDYANYLINRYLIENKRLGVALSYTSKAIFLSAVTTMFGFGSLWFVGSYTAIAALGAVIFLGVFSTLILTQILLPALLGEKKSL